MPYLTPDAIPTELICRRLRIPNNIEIIGAVTGALNELCRVRNWEEFGDTSVTDMVQAMTVMLDDFKDFDACMIGAIIPFVRNVVPANWLRCNGATHLRVDYPDLYELLIDTPFELDADHFTTPALEGVFLLGAHLDFPVYEYGGEIEHVLTIAEMPSHDHAMNIANAVVTIGTGAPANVKIPIGAQLTGNRGAGQPHNNMPPYFTLQYAIIAK